MIASKLFQTIFARVPYEPENDKFNTDPWLTEHDKEEWIIESSDHIELGAWLFRNTSDIYVIFVHGYHSDITAQGAVCRTLHDEMGWNVLLVSPRGTGISQGEYVTFGDQERYDIAQWAHTLAQKEPSSKIVLMGWSMGAHSVLGALGEELPANVIAAVADCGYVRPDEQIRITMKQRHRWIPFSSSIIDKLDAHCRSDYNFTIQYSVEEALSLNHVPLLLIHGAEDKLVSRNNAIRAHRANAGEKHLLLIEGAGHCESFRKAKPSYLLALRNIVRKHS